MILGPYRVMPMTFSPESVAVLPPLGIKDVTRRLSTYLRAGDIGYCQERWAVSRRYAQVRPSAMNPGTHAIRYATDGGDLDTGKWRPPMFMLPWMSRKTFLVRDVRREPLWAIADESDDQGYGDGPRREGCSSHEIRDLHGQPLDLWEYPCSKATYYAPSEAYAAWWDSFAREKGTRWQDNPLVYRVEVDTICRNVYWVLDRLQSGKTWEQVKEEAGSERSN